MLQNAFQLLKGSGLNKGSKGRMKKSKQASEKMWNITSEVRFIVMSVMSLQGTITHGLRNLYFTDEPVVGLGRNTSGWLVMKKLFKKKALENFS